MSKSLAVYSSKPAISGAKLVSLAAEVEVTLRYLALGGHIPHDPDRLQGKLDLGVLVVGANPKQRGLLAEFDRHYQLGARVPIANMLNSEQLPWCEI